jgi:hypothetical protein
LQHNGLSLIEVQRYGFNEMFWKKSAQQSASVFNVSIRLQIDEIRKTMLEDANRFRKLIMGKG